MIKVTYTRDGSVMREFETEAVKEIGNLVKYEFGYGGYLTELSETRLEVTTRVLGCVDHSIYEGSAEEMAPLIEISRCFASLGMAVMEDARISSTVAAAIKAAKLPTAMLTTYAAMCVGGRVARAAVLMMLCKEDQVSAEHFKKQSLSDLMALLELKLVDGATLEELYDLAA